MKRKNPRGIVAYAEYRNCALSTVQHAIKIGRIPGPDKNGSLDFTACDQAWEDNTDLSKRNRKSKPKEEDDSDLEPDVEKKTTATSSFNTARAVRETYQAQLTRLKYQTIAAQFVPIVKVKEDWFKIARQVRDSWMNFPDQVSAELLAMIRENLERPDLDFKVNNFLRQRIRRLFEELANAEKRYGLDAGEEPKGE